MQQHDSASSTNQEYVNGRQAAKVLGVSDSFFRNLLRTGQGPRFVQLGRARRFSVTALHRYMQEREQ